MVPKTLALCFLLGFSSSALAQLDAGSRDAADELVATLKEEMKELDADDDMRAIQAMRQYIRMVQMAVAQHQPGRDFGQTLDSFGDFDPSEEIVAAVEKLRKSVRDAEENKIRLQIEDLENMLAAARQAVETAEVPADLDETVRSLSRQRNELNQNSTNSQRVRGLVNEIGSARQFATGWQDYLQAADAKDIGRALDILERLSKDEHSLLPRSQVLARIEFERDELGDLVSIIESIRSLDDMKGACERLHRLQLVAARNNYANTSFRETIQALSRLEKAYREHLAGFPVEIDFSPRQHEALEPATVGRLAELRTALLRRVLPSSLGLPEEMKLEDGEPISRFLDRALKNAAEREDLLAGQRIVDIRRIVDRSAGFHPEEIEALRNYAGGVAQKEAGQYFLAVMSLQTAIASGSPLVPVAKAGGLLDTIRNEHPEEYQDAMADFITPRPIPEFDYSRMMYRRYLPYDSPSGVPRAEPAVSVVIPSAAAKPDKTPPAEREKK